MVDESWAPSVKMPTMASNRTESVWRPTKAVIQRRPGRLRSRGLGERTSICDDATAVRAADRRLPTRAGLIDADARQHHSVDGDVHSAGPTAGSRPCPGPAFVAGEGVLHPSDVRDVGYARELLRGNRIVLDHSVGWFAADAEAIYSCEGTREMNTLIAGRSLTGLSPFV